MSFRAAATNSLRVCPTKLSLVKKAFMSRGAFYSTIKLSTPQPPTGLILARAQAVSRSQQVRFASSGSVSKEDIQRRILEVLSSFEKCDPAKITPTASFTSDLGLDSLDAVEVVMAIEEEFSIEIPDEEADKITTVSEAISYIERTPEAI